MTITRNDTPRRPAGADDSLTRQFGRDSSVPQVFDFSSPDSAPEPRLVDLPTWPGYIAHVRWPHDGPILLLPEVYQPDQAVDLRCGHCTARPVIAFDQLDKRLIFMIHHARGCPAADDLMAAAGAS